MLLRKFIVVIKRVIKYTFRSKNISYWRKTMNTKQDLSRLGSTSLVLVLLVD